MLWKQQVGALLGLRKTTDQVAAAPPVASNCVREGTAAVRAAASPASSSPRTCRPPIRMAWPSRSRPVHVYKRRQPVTSSSATSDIGLQAAVLKRVALRRN